MTKLEWGREKDRSFETGIDRGVVYVHEGSAAAWNGLISVEGSTGSEIKEFFLDGVRFFSHVTNTNWTGNLTAFSYPEEFDSVIGIEELADGLFVDNQGYKMFNLSYRTMVSSPADNGIQHYKIHLYYNLVANLSEVEHQTLSDDIEPSEFEFELSSAPEMLTNLKPTSHVTIDTRKVDPYKLSELEVVLYGSEDSDPEFPTPEFLVDLLSFDEMVTVVYNGDGTWTATGSNANVYMLTSRPSGGRPITGSFQINNVDVTYEGDGIYSFDGLTT